MKKQPFVKILECRFDTKKDTQTHRSFSKNINSEYLKLFYLC